VLKLEPCQQQAPGNGGARGIMSDLSHELLMRERLPSSPAVNDIRLNMADHPLA
jgi:hypothetical protein